MARRKAGEKKGKHGNQPAQGFEPTPSQEAKSQSVLPCWALPTRELSLLLAVWLVLSTSLLVFAWNNRTSPGPYYDEALFAGLAKDFVKGTTTGTHIAMPLVVRLFGRPFPILIQSYLGGLKSWFIIPSFMIFGSSLAVLRISSLFWALIALLFFMLWTHKLLGLPAALIAGPLLGFNPSFFFFRSWIGGQSFRRFSAG